jgi:hypothetical protein
VVSKLLRETDVGTGVEQIVDEGPPLMPISA